MQDHVRKLCTSRNELTSAKAASEILKLCSNGDPSQSDIVREVGGLRQVITLAETGSDGKNGGSREAAMRILMLLAKNEDNKVFIAQVGGAKACITAIDDSRASSEVKAAAAATLSALATNVQNKVTIAHAGGIEALLRLAERWMNVQDVRFAAAALRNLACNNSQNKAVLATPRAVTILVRLLVSAEADRVCEVAEEAAATLANVARTVEDDHRIKIGDTDAISPLIKIASSEIFSSLCRVQAIGALAVLACADVNRAKILSEKGVECFTRIIATGPACCKPEATCALQNLTAATFIDGRKSTQFSRLAALAIVEAQCIPNLIRLLDSKHGAIVASTAATLRNLTVLCDAARQILDGGAVLAIARILRQTYKANSPPSREVVEAMALLRNLAFNAKVGEMIGSAELTRRLVAVLRAKHDNRLLPELTLATLANLVAKNHKYQLAFNEAQGTRILQHILDTKRATQLEKRHARGVLKNLDMHQPSKANMRRQDRDDKVRRPLEGVSGIGSLSQSIGIVPSGDGVSSTRSNYEQRASLEDHHTTLVTDVDLSLISSVV